jgi:hypothetical protein
VLVVTIVHPSGYIDDDIGLGAPPFLVVPTVRISAQQNRLEHRIERISLPEEPQIRGM